MKYGDVQACECCGRLVDRVPVGMSDDSGNMWTHYVCDQCRNTCTSDSDGNPVCSVDCAK